MSSLPRELHSTADSSSLQHNIVREGEYARKGDFHRDLDPRWTYYPIYLNKLEVIDDLLNAYGAHQGKILDAGCGEGVLVDKYAHQGWNIVGLDKNYQSKRVRQGSITKIPFKKGHFDHVLCLDVLEHLNYTEQIIALKQIKVVLKPGGILLVSVPNLAHLRSRLRFLFRGKALRTASISHHPGDRPAAEYQELLESMGYKVEQRVGIFPTLPLLYRFVKRHPERSVELLRFLRKLPLPVFWNFQVIFVCRRASE